MNQNDRSGKTLNSWPIFTDHYIKTVGSDTETRCNTGNKMANFNNLFVSFNLKFLRVSLEEATKLPLAIKICESQL